MKRLTLDQLKANDVAMLTNLIAIKGGQMNKCHPKLPSPPPPTGSGGIPAEY